MSVNGNVSGYSSVGGLVGKLENGSLNLGNFKGNVQSRVQLNNLPGNQAASNLGGLIGLMASDGSLSNSYFDGVLNGVFSVGGLVGNNLGFIHSSYANLVFNVPGAQYVGGLVGINVGGTNDTNGSIVNSYANGSINANDIAGGLVGYNDTGSLQNNYSLVKMTGLGGTIGPVIGVDYAGSHYINIYYDTSINPGLTGPGTGLTHAQILQSSNFQGFNFSNTWFSYDGYTAPLLRNFLTPLEVTVTVSGSKTYDGSGNYNIRYEDNTSSAIDKADLTVTATQVTKTYDGTTAANGSGSVATRSSSSTKQWHRRSNRLICSLLTRWEMPAPAARLCCCPPAYKKTWHGPATRHQATRHQATNHKITHYRAIQLRTTHYPTHPHRKKTMTIKNEPSDIFKNPS